jgi:signal recognition particle subunit SRP54
VFESLSEKLQKTFRALTGQGHVSEAVLDSTLREIRLALLEADVAIPVVKTLLERVREKALGEEVLKSLTPGQQVVKVVRDELAALLGTSGGSALKLAAPWPSVILMAGLQGSGKTTSSAKLALHLKKKDRSPLLVPADIYRPAATLQLLQVARQASVAAFEPAGTGETPLQIVKAARARARQAGHDVLIVDTAGRLHIDDDLMNELAGLRDELRPVETLYVADAMTGQDAVRSARTFHERIGLTGVILTKMDGDARGGAALSVAAVAGVPIKFAGTGEGLTAFEAFDPGRMTGRILGLGDLLGLIEKAEESFDAEEAKALEKKLRRNEFTLEDFRDQLRKMRKMGPLSEIISMIPGAGALRGAEPDPKELRRVEAIIDSMTPRERGDHTLLNGSRKKRIARGSGTSVPEINRLVKQFAQMKKMMKSMQGARPGTLPRGFRLPQGVR